MGLTASGLKTARGIVGNKTHCLLMIPKLLSVQAIRIHLNGLAKYHTIICGLDIYNDIIYQVKLDEEIPASSIISAPKWYGIPVVYKKTLSNSQWKIKP